MVRTVCNIVESSCSCASHRGFFVDEISLPGAVPIHFVHSPSAGSSISSWPPYQLCDLGDEGELGDRGERDIENSVRCG